MDEFKTGDRVMVEAEIIEKDSEGYLIEICGAEIYVGTVYPISRA